MLLLFPNFLYAFDSQEQRIIEEYTNSQSYKDLNEFLWDKSDGNPIALFLLGMTTLRGQGTPQDTEGAAELFIEAWSGGFTEAGSAYCLLLVRDKLSPLSYSNCLETVVKSGNPTAKEALAYLIMENDALLPHLKDKYDYQELLNEAYEAGSGFSALMLFSNSRKNRPDKFYTPLEFNYLKKAAKSFWLMSLYNNTDVAPQKAYLHLELAFAYLKGSGIEPNIEKYFEHLKISFDYGGAEASCHLAQAYMIGAGAKQDIDKAAKYLKIGKKRGCKKHKSIELQLTQRGIEMDTYANYEIYSPEPRIWDFSLTLDSDLINSEPNEREDFEALNGKLYPDFKKRSSMKIVPSPRGTCQSRGNFTSCSDGSTYQRIGNFTYGSDGTTFNTIGNTTFSSDGTTYHTIGKTTFSSDGTTYNRIGRNTLGSDGTFCQTYGNITNCQ